MTNLTLNLTPETIDYAQIYNFIQDYPNKTFYLLLIGFIALILYIYTPILIRNIKIKELAKQIFLSAAFMLVGFGVFSMIPIHYTMTPKTINIINYTFNGIVFIGVAIVLTKLYLHIKKNKQ